MRKFEDTTMKVLKTANCDTLSIPPRGRSSGHGGEFGQGMSCLER
jgi:hypothetical protein